MSMRSLRQRSLRCAESVSYTHLDVYKRQGIGCARLAGVSGQVKSLLLLQGVVIAEYTAEPVSYTHLIVATLDKDTCNSREEALVEIYRKLRPGDPPTVESSETLLEGLFYCLLYTSRCV